jgi:hypothetical protein
MALADRATLAHRAAIENGPAADFSSISEISPRVRNGLRLLERVDVGATAAAALTPVAEPNRSPRQRTHPRLCATQAAARARADELEARPHAGNQATQRRSSDRDALEHVRVPTLHVTATEDVIRIPGDDSGASDRVAVFEAGGDLLGVEGAMAAMNP